MAKYKLNLILTFFLFFASSALILAQSSASTADPERLNRILQTVVLVAGITVIIVALISLTNLVNVFLQIQRMRLLEEQGIEVMEKAGLLQRESFWKKWYKRATNVVPIEKEKDILFDHNYDGIRELDNSLPPWWVAMFYITILFAGIYMVYYHFGGNGPSSIDYYNNEVAQAEEYKQQFLAKQADQVDESNVAVLNDGLAISQGQSIYQVNCIACHGASGEGGVGPNLTDKYWIHGGDVKDIFKTIKYGVPEKGMIAWKDQLRPIDMQKLASFIMTLQGTNPPNGKAPQGDLYQPQVAGEQPPADSTAANQNSTIGMID